MDENEGHRTRGVLSVLLVLGVSLVQGRDE